MKCEGCGKKLSWIKRCSDRLVGNKVYKLRIIDDNNKTIARKPVCEECGRFYSYICVLIKQYGDDVVLEGLEKFLQQRAEEDNA